MSLIQQMTLGTHFFKSQEGSIRLCFKRPILRSMNATRRTIREMPLCGSSQPPSMMSMDGSMVELSSQLDSPTHQVPSMDQTNMFLMIILTVANWLVMFVHLGNQIHQRVTNVLHGTTRGLEQDPKMPSVLESH